MEKYTSEIAEKARSYFESDEVKATLDAIEKAAAGETGTFEVVITTENLDRYQEVISLDGWELEHYRNNPVVLWGHDHFTLPIGAATEVRIEDGKMIARGQFAPHDFAQEIRSLYDAGVVRATSVGFIEKEREGNLITKAELLEFSFVSVPANPYALSLAMEKELNINELVTKGILSLKEVGSDNPEDEPEEGETPESQPAAEPADPDPAEEPETPPELSDEQKALAAKIADEIINKLRHKDGALEDATPSDPEGTEPEQEGETPEEKQMREFNEARKLLQDASTVIGDVLAQARQSIHSRR